jgi:peroxiredoxin/mono/diheme cytochrome c family protein
LLSVICGLFGPVGDFVLPKADGTAVRLSEYAAGRPLVVVFLGTGCPLAARYAPVLDDFDKRFTGRVAVIGVLSNEGETPDDVSVFTRHHRFRNPILFDFGATVADRLGAARTPEVVLLDAARRVRYRGRIDDRYAVGDKDRGQATREDLAEAISEVLAGRPVTVPVTRVSGCPICRPSPRRETTRTYVRNVAAVIDSRCAGCHRPGGIGPFSLTDFAETKAKAASIAEVLADGRMPPWHASSAYGKFRNDPRLSLKEKQSILDWVAAGCPEGDPKDRPTPPAVPTGWAIGTPDRVLTFPEAYDIPATGEVPYRHVFLDPGFRTDVWVKAIEFRAGNRSVVHHCNVFLHPPDQPETDSAFETGALGSSNLLAYTPGCGPGRFADGWAKRIPAGWKLHFVIHYTTTGTPQKDRSELGFVFARPDSVRKEVATKLILTEDFVLPPGSTRRVEQTWTTDRDLLALAYFPHMHLRGKSFRYVAEYPDGTAEILLDVPDYDFHWQHRYELVEPKRLPVGTVIRCSAVFDNSSNNPANPDPTGTVRPGPRSTDEMFNGYIDVVDAHEDLVADRESAAVRRHWSIAGLLAAVAGLGMFGLRMVSRRRPLR